MGAKEQRYESSGNILGIIRNLMDEIGKLSFDFNYIFMCRSSISFFFKISFVHLWFLILCFVFKIQVFFIRLNTVLRKSISLQYLKFAYIELCYLLFLFTSPLRIIWCALLDFWLSEDSVFWILWGSDMKYVLSERILLTFESCVWWYYQHKMTLSKLFIWSLLD